MSHRIGGNKNAKPVDEHVSKNGRNTFLIAYFGQLKNTVSNTKSLVMRKSAFCICENKDADQLRGNREADQRLCSRYIDSTTPLLLTYEISSL